MRTNNLRCMTPRGLSSLLPYCFIIVIFAITQECTWARFRHAPSWDGDSTCIKCPPGHGAERPCRPRGQQTLCRPCSAGKSYSGHHSYKQPCIPCSRCGPGLFEAHPCTLTSDTVCDSCRTTRPNTRDNPDFRRKCVQPTSDTTQSLSTPDWQSSQSTNPSSLGKPNSAIESSDDDARHAETRTSWRIIGVGIALLLGAIALAAVALRVTAWTHTQVPYTRFQNVDMPPTTI